MKSKGSNKFESKNSFINHITYHKQKTISKNSLITSMCKNKKVLDLGCIDHSYETAISLGDKWLHRMIKNVSSELTGLDILKEDIEKLNNEGYNIIYGDAENFQLNQKFDIIIAGDLIEHLSNIGLFLNCVKEHMDSNSIFIFTTPNPFSFEQSMIALFDNRVYVNSQHTVWLDPNVSWELLSREGFNIIDFHWIDTMYSFSVQRKFYRLIINPFIRYIMRKKNIVKRDFAVISTI